MRYEEKVYCYTWFHFGIILLSRKRNIIDSSNGSLLIYILFLFNDNNNIQIIQISVWKRENELERMMRRYGEECTCTVGKTAHTFEVHVCVVSLSFTKLLLKPNQKPYKSVITWLTNGFVFVTESRDNNLSPSFPTEPYRLFPAEGD